MIVKGVVFTSDMEGNKFYIPESKMFEWFELIEAEYNVPEWATPVEGELFVVDIKEKLCFAN